MNAMSESQSDEILGAFLEALRSLKAGDTLNKEEIQVLERELSKIDDPLLRKHLKTMIDEIGRGEIEEGDLLSKILSQEGHELMGLLRSMLEFSYEEPFSELETNGIVNFWISLLREITRSKRKRSTS